LGRTKLQGTSSSKRRLYRQNEDELWGSGNNEDCYY